MQRHPPKDILEEEEDGKYTKSGISRLLLHCMLPNLRAICTAANFPWQGPSQALSYSCFPSDT